MEIIKEKYYSLLKNYFNNKDEVSLFEASELGRELVKRNLSAEDVAEIHEYAIQQLGKEFPELKLQEISPYISSPLLEMLMAYGLAFREMLERSNSSEQKLIKNQQHLERLVKERTSELVKKNKELEQKNKDLEEFNQLFINRELRIKELRDRIKELEKK